jgi:membrane fusion protein (multidrug efflux system)
MTKSRKYRYALIHMMWLLLLGTACGTSQQDEPAVAGETEKSSVQTVEVVRPGYESFISSIDISGIAQPNRAVSVYAMEGGMIDRLRCDIGDKVSKGQVLAEMINPELVRMSESLNAQKEAKETYDNTPSITPLQEVESAKSDFEQVSAELAAVMDRIGFLNIKAPFSGIVSQRLVDEGAVVQSGLAGSGAPALFEIQQYDPIRVSLPLPESEAAVIAPGMEANVSFPKIQGASQVLPISRVSGAIDPNTGTMQVEIDVPNEDLKILPGTYAKVRIEIANRKDVRTLPVQAQFIVQDSPWLMVVENDVVKRIPLKKGLSDRTYFEVLNEEISDSSLVIVQGKSLVSEGQVVKPIEKQSE